LSNSGLRKKISPSLVKNKDAYNELLMKEKELENDPERFYKSNTIDFTFDLLVPYIKINKQVKENNIPEYEAAIILKKSKEFTSRYFKLNKLRFEAVGGKNEFGERFTVLDARKAELIGLFGKFNTLAETHKIVTTEWGLNISYSNLEKFRANNLDTIQAEQDKYVRDWSGLKLVYKRGRLDEYSGLYEDRKIRYDETHNRDDYKLLLQTLEAIRKEIEGDRLTVDGSLEVNVQQTINLHVQQDLLKNLNILQFIIARVAVRMGKSQSVLMERLEKSYYAKFSGILPPDNNINTDEIYYPSRELYDFNKIKAANATVIEDVQPLPEVKEEIKQQGNALMEALLKRKLAIIESEKKLASVPDGSAKKIIKRKRKTKKVK
jgi:hypothetical protein